MSEAKLEARELRAIHLVSACLLQSAGCELVLAPARADISTQASEHMAWRARQMANPR